MGRQRTPGHLDATMTWDEPSTLAVALSAQLGLPVYVVNSSAKPYPRGRRIEWSDLPLRKKRITYVIEDLTSLTEGNKARVMELLNVASRHQVRFFLFRIPPSPKTRSSRRRATCSSFFTACAPTGPTRSTPT